MIDTATTVQTIYYILKKSKDASLDKIKILKLVYLADKYHLLMYGRTITNDRYYAMDYGPVASTAKDVLSFNQGALSDNELNYAKKLLRKDGEFSFSANNGDEELDLLSETDQEAIDKIVEKFGNIEGWKLSELTHQYPEWSNRRHLFANGRTLRDEIKIEELLSTIPDDPLGVLEERIKESLEILQERQCCMYAD